MPETPPEESVVPPSSPSDTGLEPTTGPAEPDEGANREAAKYRTKLRETEAQNATLTGRLEAMQRREVERLASADLDTPEDLWLTDVGLGTLLDDDGQVDEAKVSAAVTTVLQGRPGWRRPSPVTYDGGARSNPPVPVSMQDLLQGRRRRP